MSWALHRVDDRLIHGQVVVAWGRHLHPQRIWVVDDATAANDWERKLLATAAPGVEVRVLTVAEAAAEYAQEASAEGASILLVRNLTAAAELLGAGAAIPAFNLGGIHYAPGRTKVNDYIYLSADDRVHARSLIARGVRLTVQDVPAARAVSLSELEPELARS
jgi:mannose/fructose/N-acetylgalactosamine-specific phosphotransferase system component IIB